ncbi:MAG TPA: four helix bundle protein [Opitutaceae bacterium]|nr:four helix bundle protein [Opitutaceae bacterium]HRJ46735.1 four helix bundle protein [Opitutaceae bacterium]
MDDLAERTEWFAVDVRRFAGQVPATVSNTEDLRQVVRSSGSVAANHIEADNALGKQDRLMRFRICRKEARESGLWIRLINPGDTESLRTEQARLNDEATQLVKIYSTIINRLGGQF